MNEDFIKLLIDYCQEKGYEAIPYVSKEKGGTNIDGSIRNITHLLNECLNNPDKDFDIGGSNYRVLLNNKVKTNWLDKNDKYKEIVVMKDYLVIKIPCDK